MSGWIGVDLDATLARYDGWKGVNHIGEPIQPMVERVKNWLAQGIEVRIFTARVSGQNQTATQVLEARLLIENWCIKHIGVALRITAEKDYEMVELWDDRAVQVIPNTGKSVGSSFYFQHV